MVVGALPQTPFATIAMNDANATRADLYVLKSWTVDSTSPVTISGMNPAIILVLTTVDIQGSVSVAAGGFDLGSAPGPGGGQAGGGGAGGGGGSYCGVGGLGGAMGTPIPMGGSTYGSAPLTPLIGGSAGGGACGNPSGGGAVQIVAGVSIAVRQYGVLNAGGFGATCGAAGGSGGAILLEAPTVQIAGSLAANGGGGASSNANGAGGTTDGTPAVGGSAGNDGGLGFGGNGSSETDIHGGNGGYGSTTGNGGGGGGGAGRIRINTKSGSATVTGIVSPALGALDGGTDSGTVCSTQGALNP